MGSDYCFILTMTFSRSVPNAVRNPNQEAHERRKKLRRAFQIAGELLLNAINEKAKKIQ
jgi:hypothetical protein